ncbi:MAG: ribonuclease HII [Candidatus Aminicenantales bacterium]
MRLAERCNGVLYPAGAVIGPLVIAGVALDEKKLPELVRLRVRDSKELSPRRREHLAKKIETLAEDIVIVKVAACKIDKYRKEGINLNRLEALKFGEILNFLKADKAYIDAPETPHKLKLFLEKLTGKKVKLVVEHKADTRYPIVGAASIVAKVTRDEVVEELKKKYGDFGPGYPSNEITIKWMKEWSRKHKEFPECVRMSWETTKAIEREKAQRKLGKWLKGKSS